MSTRPKSQNVLPFIAEGAAFNRQTFSRNDTAAILNISVDTVDSEIARGKLKAFQAGRLKRITGRAIADYQAGQVTPWPPLPSTKPLPKRC